MRLDTTFDLSDTAFDLSRARRLQTVQTDTGRAGGMPTKPVPDGPTPASGAMTS
jgi:hypothetical protein